MKKLRFGLIGFSQGHYATNYTRALLCRPEVELVACCDLGASPSYVQECAFTTAEEFCREVGMELVHDLDSFFQRDLDVVMVASETADHCVHTLRALEEGCQVFVSKPLSFVSREVQAIKECAESKNLLVLPGQPLRYEEGILEAAERVRRGEVGEPINIRLFLCHEAMVHQEWERDPARSGGPLGTFGVYLFDIVRWVTGQEFVELFAYGDNFVFPQIKAADTVQIGARLASGALVQLNLASTMTWPYPFVNLEVIGTEGVLRTNYDNYTVLVQKQGSVSLGGIRYSPMGDLEINHFIDCCLQKAAPRITLEDMLRAAQGIEAAARSMALGTKVRLSEVEP
jgi:predicted dehydrogenase